MAGWLQTNERLVIYGTAVDPAAQSELALAYRGSRVRQVPQSILADYRREWRNDSYEWINLTDSHEGNDVDAATLGTA